MPRRFNDPRIVVASHNKGKVREIADLLAPLGIEAVSALDLGLDEPEETGLTFEANAELKALAAAQASGMPALADDSGLCVDALDGDPGIYSARWAEHKGTRDFSYAMEKVHEALIAKGAQDDTARSAHFACALTLAWPDGHMETFLGTVEGTIVWPPRGAHGFGYDPVFRPTGETRTFGEIAAPVKHAMSHRANAFRLLIEACIQND